jgi:hypothetical protein
MCVSVCSTCNKLFTEYGSFEGHKCVTDLKKLSDEELLEKVYKSGGCSKSYYEAEKAKLKKESK